MSGWEEEKMEKPIRSCDGSRRNDLHSYSRTSHESGMIDPGFSVNLVTRRGEKTETASEWKDEAIHPHRIQLLFPPAVSA